jgi:predicted GIY-YIG superfamily endonuclease
MTALYRVRGEAGLLLYIGISNDFGRRWKQHARKQPWWGEKRSLSVDKWYPSREEAEAAEAAAIQAERPKHNQRHGIAPVQLYLGIRPQELTRAERASANRIVRLRISDPDFAKLAESRKCWSCGAQPGELCHTTSGRIAYYHQFRWGDFRRRPDAGRTMPTEPDLIGM